MEAEILKCFKSLINNRVRVFQSDGKEYEYLYHLIVGCS